MTNPVWSFTLETFGKRASKVYDQLCRAVLVEAVQEIGRRWLPLAIARTPIGGIMSKARRDRAPGMMQRGWRWKISRAGTKRLSNEAPHALIIDRGRKRGVTPVGAKSRVRARRGKKLKPNKSAKWLGSKLAPQGVTRPVWRIINKAQRAEISRIAIRKAEASVPGERAAA